MAPDRSASEAGPQVWDARLVDVGELPLGARSDAAPVLERLFGLDPPTTTGVETLREIARRIVRGRRPWLCLLDSAELLDKNTARHLRWCLSEIYRMVRDAATHSDVRLAVVVASRREDEWRGVTPAPRVSPLSLTEFSVDVVRQALYDLAQETSRNVAAAELQQHAERVHRLGEGLPALLVRCLQWIQAEEWVDMGRLESQELFEELARPYVQQGLLSADSLVPWGGQKLDEQRAALVEAFRVLAPYRLFTQSHLRHHLDSDRHLREAQERLGWPVEDLWRAIGETALLSRPLNEAWQEVYAPIRRLLDRYYNRTDDERASAHRGARKFVEAWAANQAGKEQAVGVVECLWHEAVVLRLQWLAEMERELRKSAMHLSWTLKESQAYTVTELRAFTARQMRNDEELQEAVRDVPGLFDRLVDIVAPTPGGAKA